jgi:hypothetical protein
MIKEPASLEAYIAKLNGLAFWSEFSFENNKFTPAAGQQLELADSLVWFGRFVIALQLKERTIDSGDPVAEKTWFENKVLKKGTKQIRDTLHYLSENNKIAVQNQRGHTFEISTSEIDSVLKIVVYLGSKSLPEECWQTRFHVSRTAGFIHIVAAHDYLGILDKLRVPEDIRRYFAYRENALLKAEGGENTFDEPDIMGAFVSDQDMPSANSRQALRGFLQDTDSYDLSGIIGNLHRQIQRSQDPYDYYKIMLEFARLPRSMWREIKSRFILSLNAVRDARFARPYLVAYPATDCAFMIAPLDPEMPSTGQESEELRLRGLQNLTDAAMYVTKMSKGIGLVMSKDGEYHQWDWAFIALPWERDEKMERRLSECSPFRTTSEKSLPSFLFISD